MNTHNKSHDTTTNSNSSHESSKNGDKKESSNNKNQTTDQDKQKMSSDSAPSSKPNQSNAYQGKDIDAQRHPEEQMVPPMSHKDFIDTSVTTNDRAPISGNQ